MIEDPRKQQMKALKGEMVRNIIISLLIAVVIFVGLSGCRCRRSQGKADCFCAGDL